MRFVTMFVVLVCAAGLVVSIAGAKGSAVDLATNVAVGTSLRDVRPQLNGATVQTKLKFWAGPGVDLITALPATATVRFDLPSGISFGGVDLPDPSEGCTGTATTATCITLPLEPIAGKNSVGWGWDLVAATPGSYVLTAEIVQSSDIDPDASNDRASVTVVASDSQPGGGGGGGGGGGVASVSASLVKLSPARPRAGSLLVASVRVTRGGTPVKPAGITCVATVGKVKVRGGPKSSSGVASCLFKTPRSGKGKTMLGSVSFKAGGQSFTKRFSARLR